MPRQRTIPAYRLHKASGQARVILNGKHVYLGPFGSPQSREAYARRIAEQVLSAGGHRSSRSRWRAFRISRLTSYWSATWNSRPSTTWRMASRPRNWSRCADALGPVRLLYGSLAAREFGPLKLKAVRQYMIEQGLARGVINHRVNRIKRVIKWAVSEELLPPSVYEGARTVTGYAWAVRQRETNPVGPVGDAVVDAVLPHVAPPVAAMIELQRLTGMRPGEVVRMRPSDIDVTGDVWIYSPMKHKTRWRGHRRTMPLGPSGEGDRAAISNGAHRRILFSPQERRHRATSSGPSTAIPGARQRSIPANCVRRAPTGSRWATHFQATQGQPLYRRQLPPRDRIWKCYG